MVRSAGVAPASPEWKSGILLLEDDRIVKMKTNTAASPVMDSHPQECFTADLSVFQAHLPWRDTYILYHHARPLVCISCQGGKSDNAMPSVDRHKTTHLTWFPQTATVIAVARLQTFPSGTMDCSDRSTRRQLPLAAGFSHPCVV